MTQREKRRGEAVCVLTVLYRIVLGDKKKVRQRRWNILFTLSLVFDLCCAIMGVYLLII